MQSKTPYSTYIGIDKLDILDSGSDFNGLQTTLVVKSTLTGYKNVDSRRSIFG